MIDLSALSDAVSKIADAVAENRRLREEASASQAAVDAMVRVLEDALAPKVAPVVPTPTPAAVPVGIVTPDPILQALSNAAANAPK